jgi:hypothetical protein
MPALPPKIPHSLPPVAHERLLIAATRHGTGEILRQMPAEYSPELEAVIRQGVHQAVLCYAAGLESLPRYLHPLEQEKIRA